MPRVLTSAVPVLLLGCALLSSIGAGAGGEAATDQEPLPSGQLLARFTTGGAMDNEVVRLLGSGETISDTLHDLVARLARSLEMPLFVRRITAGRELLLEIERSALLDTVAGRLRNSTTVRSVEVERLAGSQRYWRDRLLLEPLPGGELAQAAARADAADAAQAMQDVLALQLAQPYTVIEAERVSPQRVALRIDLQATTLRLVQALEAQADVQYAQPNFVATIN